MSNITKHLIAKLTASAIIGMVFVAICFFIALKGGHAQSFIPAGAVADSPVTWSAIESEMNRYSQEPRLSVEVMLSKSEYRSLVSHLPEGYKVIRMGRNNSQEMIQGDGIELWAWDLPYTRMNVIYTRVSKSVHMQYYSSYLRWGGNKGWVPLTFTPQD